VPCKRNITAQSGWSFRLLRIAAMAGMTLCTLASLQLHAQDSKDADKAEAVSTPGKNSRKLLHKVAPAYPEDLRSRNIGGVVKLDVKIAAGGNVEKVAIVGGNPILADSAARAVKQWQYAPSSSPTNLLLSVEFNPTH
jgi:TonB family protein